MADVFLEAEEEEPQPHHHHQASTCLTIPAGCMRRLVREMLPAHLHMSEAALKALHCALEAYAVDVFATSEQLLRLSDTATVEVRHLHAATQFYKGRSL